MASRVLAPLILAIVPTLIKGGDPNSRHPHLGIEQPFAPGVAPKLTGKELGLLAKGKTVFSQDRSGLSARVVAVQDVHASPEVVWGRIMDFGAYPRMVPLVADCSEYGRRPLSRAEIPKAGQIAPALAEVGPGPGPGSGSGPGPAKSARGPASGAAPSLLRRAAAVEDLGAQALRVGSELPANLRRAREAISQFPARARTALSAPGGLLGEGRGAGAPAAARKRGADKPGVSEEILVELVMKLGVVRCTNYLRHQHYPHLNSVTWTLDYTRKSDFDESVGHWHVVPLPCLLLLRAAPAKVHSEAAR